jgi:hypothetical protein
MYSKVYIGDDTKSFRSYAEQVATEYFPNSESKNIFLSVNKVSIKDLSNVCLNTKDIIYCPPSVWSSDDIKYHTIGWIEYLSSLRNVKQLRAGSYGLGPIKYENQNYRHPEFLNPVDLRKTTDSQIWMAGCSFTNGHGLENKNCRFGQLFANKLNMPVSFLTMNGASNQWAADQILKSDIRKTDFIFWGITGIARSTLYTEEKQWPITISMLDKQASIYQKLIVDNKKIAPMRRMITEEFLLSTHSLYESFNHIQQVRNFLDKIGCKYLIGYFADLDFPYVTHLGKMMHYIVSQNDPKLFVIKPEYPWADITIRSTTDANDDDTPVHHPGPVQHQVYAEDLLNRYNILYK